MSAKLLLYNIAMCDYIDGEDKDKLMDDIQLALDQAYNEGIEIGALFNESWATRLLDGPNCDPFINPESFPFWCSVGNIIRQSAARIREYKK